MQVVDTVLAAFFAIHVPLVLLIDSAAVLPPGVLPDAPARLLEWHIHKTGDYLMRDKPPFFRGIVLGEMFVQLPLYIANAYAFYSGKPWRKTTGIIYGVHTATTMLPILYDIACSPLATKRGLLLMVYFPYLLIPLLVLARSLRSSSSSSSSRTSSSSVCKMD